MTKRRRRSWLSYLPFLFGGIGTVAVGGVAVYFVKQLIATPPPMTRKVIQEVKLIRPPPPPPEEEPPPPPEEVKQEVDLPEPEPTPEAPSDEPPPGELLGLDAEGVAGGDAFGLGARPGGRSLLAKGGDKYGYYAGMLKDDLISFLAENRDIRARAYSVNVRLWLDGQGAVTRVDLAGTTGDKELDRKLRDLLAGLDRVREQPPADLPQPVQIRIVSRL